MDSSLDIATVVGQIRTNKGARDALGIISGMLHNAYLQLDNISTSQGLRNQAESYLNTVNGYAQEIYGKIPDDNGALGAANGARLGLVASQTNDALANIEEAAHVSEFHLAASLRKAVEDVGKDVGNIAASPFNGLTAALIAFLHSARTGLIIVGVAGAVYVFRRPILAAVAKGVK